MRKELRTRGIHHLKVVFSPELPPETQQLEAPSPGRRIVPASVAWVPSVAGLVMGGTVVRDIIKDGGLHRCVQESGQHTRYHAELTGDRRQSRGE